MPIESKPKAPPPKESELRTLLRTGMHEAVQHLLNNNPELKFKLELNGGREKDAGEYILVDLLTGANLWLKKFVTRDREMLDMKEDVKKLANVSDEVLITGETGTGKELIARALIGDRAGAFRRINCGALPSELIESELFGHVKGAFTGADVAKKGLMVAARDGVLFLDEIGDLPLMVQAKLLNCLQPINGVRYVRPVGSVEEQEINCRVVCATHKSIKKMVADGTFRKDLYARISTFEIHITALRDRRGDIESIVSEICDNLQIPQIAKGVMEVINKAMLEDSIDLSLNVRSLEQMIKRYNVLGRL